MRTINVFMDVRPTLSVERAGGKNLGNCYNAHYYKVTSTERLDEKRLRALRAGGFLGYGQDFIIKSKCDGTEPAADIEYLPCVEKDENGKIVNYDPHNPYTGKPYAPSARPYFVYETEDRIDSGG